MVEPDNRRATRSSHGTDQKHWTVPDRRTDHRREQGTLPPGPGNDRRVRAAPEDIRIGVLGCSSIAARRFLPALASASARLTPWPAQGRSRPGRRWDPRRIARAHRRDGRPPAGRGQPPLPGGPGRGCPVGPWLLPTARRAAAPQRSAGRGRCHPDTLTRATTSRSVEPRCCGIRQAWPHTGSGLSLA